MFGDYRSGYMKALVQLEDFLGRYDFRYIIGFTKGVTNPYKCKRRSLFNAIGIQKLLGAIRDEAEVLMTWGEYAEFKLAANTGALTFTSKPDANVLRNLTYEYKKGYTDAITEVMQYLAEHRAERVNGQKQVVALVRQFIADRSYGGKLF